MKRVLFAVAALSLLPAAANAKPLEWSEVQAIGGLTLGTPYAQAGQWYLPVEADVSGLKGGAKVNSGLVCGTFDTRVQDGKLSLTLNTALAGSMGESRSAKCTPIKLGHIKAGAYDVVYRSRSEPDQPLGRVDIQP